MMTPEQLRERAAEVLRPGWMRLSDAEAREILRAHADALEEIGRLNAAWKAQQFHLEAEERESEAQESRAERAEAALAERDAEIKALNGHAERFMVEREGNSRQFARLQERLAKAEADCDAYLDDATRYSRHLKGAWMDSGDERDFYVWRDEAVQVDDAWWDKEGPSINAAIDASRKPS